MTSSAFFKPASSTRFDNEAPGATGRSGQNGRRGEIRWPPMGRSSGHQWGVSMAAYGEIPMAAVILASIFALVLSITVIQARLNAAWQAGAATVSHNTD